MTDVKENSLEAPTIASEALSTETLADVSTSEQNAVNDYINIYIYFKELGDRI